MCKFESAFTIGSRTREGSFNVSEQFTFYDVFGKGGAMRFNKGLVCAITVVVNGSRNQFFAGTGISLD